MSRSFGVVPVDVLVQGGFQCIGAEERDPVAELFLEVAKEVLHHGSIGAVAFAGH